MTNFTKWRSIIDGSGVIPDSGNLHAGYIASEIAANDAESVTTWPDASPNGFDATGGSPIYRTSVLNGEPVVDFDGVGDVFHTGYEWDTTDNRALYVVHRADTDTGNVYDFGVKASENTSFSVQTTNREFVAAYGNTFSSGGNADTNVWYIQEHHADSGSAETIANGSQVDSYSYTASGLTGDEDAIGARNEGNTSGDQFADVSIAEILVYQTAHGSSTRQSVRDYLNGKYAVF